MADLKISELTNLTAADPANDMIPIVDVSATPPASGSTKRISINNILACSPTATLASATISGDLTVDTSTLKVDSANNRVGIKQASPSHPFQIGTTDLILDATGNVGIGVTTSALTNVTRLEIGGQLSSNVTLRSTSTSSSARNWMVAANAVSFGDFAIRQGNSQGAEPNSGTDRLYIDPAGNVGIGVTPAGTGGCLQLKSGITFPATQVASSDANTLDDYEEGTFTPAISGTSVAGAGTYSNQIGRYTKVGNQVTVWIRLSWSAHTGSGDMTITGLPFTLANVNNLGAGAAIGYSANISLTAGNYLMVYGDAGNSRAYLWQTPTGGGSTNTVSMDSSGDLGFTMTYIV